MFFISGGSIHKALRISESWRIIQRVGFLSVAVIFQVLLIGGSTGKMLEALDVIGDDLDDSMSEVNSRRSNLIPLNYASVCPFLTHPNTWAGL